MPSNSEESQFKRSSAGYSITVTLKIVNRPGGFAQIVDRLATDGGSLAEVELLSSDFHFTVRRVTINCRSEEHSRNLVSALHALPEVTVINWVDDTFEAHRGGKLRVHATSEIKNTDQLSRVYTPGVARVCTHIHHDKASAHEYTIKGNTVAVVSDGSAVLGLGNIGPEAAMPVMEGKAVLFKQFAGIDGFPICLATQDTEEIINTVKYLAPTFGGINLEDISAPRCFEIEERLVEALDIPVFHDDQHGTAVVVLAGVMNALRLIGKKLEDLTVVVNGFGASGVACVRILLESGVKNIIPCDTAGAVFRGRGSNMNRVKEQMSELTNPERRQGSLGDVLKGADLFIGVSQPGAVTREMIETMARDPIVFALANPTPEIYPDQIKGIARVIATGRSDYANQVNNVLAFPGIFKGALQARARRITSAMKIAAAHAIAEAVAPHELREDYIIPGVFFPNMADRVAEKVREAWSKEDALSKSGAA
jgi:malate dehydrogenase (oxaloacetate-decarboxylating)